MAPGSSVPRYVIDTNLYIRATREDGWSQALEAFVLTFTPDLYLHSVVALELLAGATDLDLERRTEERFIRPFERRGRVFTPSHGAWKRAAGALTQLVRDHKVSPDRGITKSLVNDCIIAASARDHGFVLVTDNRKDFELVADILPLEFVPPWPDP
jgi:predicted nucleic acid-binding protein